MFYKRLILPLIILVLLTTFAGCNNTNTPTNNENTTVEQSTEKPQNPTPLPVNPTNPDKIEQENSKPDGSEQDNNEVVEKEHNLTNVEIIVEPSTTNKGKALLKCSNKDCLYKEELILPKLSNLDYVVEVVNPTCSSLGNTKYTLKNNKLVVIITNQAKLEHSFTSYDVVSPTISTAGSATRSCTMCNKTETINLPVLSSKDYIVSTVDATCTAEGSTKYTLKTNDKFSFTTTIDKLPHSYSNWEITKPSILNTGLASRHCSCGKTEEVTLPVTSSEKYSTIVDNKNNEVQFNLIGTDINFTLQLFSYSKIDDTSCAITGINIAQKDVYIPNMIDKLAVKAIADNAFNLNNSEIINTITIPEGVVSIGSSTFYKQNITSIKLPSTLKTIGNYAFAGCTKLASVSAENLESIGTKAFYNCNLSTFTLTSTVTSIGKKAFCNQQKDITINSKISKEQIRVKENTGNFKLGWDSKSEVLEDKIKINFI